MNQDPMPELELHPPIDDHPGLRGYRASCGCIYVLRHVLRAECKHGEEGHPRITIATEVRK